jgi:hypothetical protein
LTQINHFLPETNARLGQSAHNPMCRQTLDATSARGRRTSRQLISMKVRDSWSCESKNEQVVDFPVLSKLIDPPGKNYEIGALITSIP